jgi:hypothetical protein
MATMFAVCVARAANVETTDLQPSKGMSLFCSYYSSVLLIEFETHCSILDSRDAVPCAGSIRCLCNTALSSFAPPARATPPPPSGPHSPHAHRPSRASEPAAAANSERAFLLSAVCSMSDYYNMPAQLHTYRTYMLYMLLYILYIFYTHMRALTIDE